MDGERKSYTERILSAIEFGKLSNIETERRLMNLVDAEIDKTDTAADQELIRACQSLLWQLHVHGEIVYDSHGESNLQEIKTRIQKRELCKERGIHWCKFGFSVAAVLVLILSLCGKLEWSWFEHKTSPDEQQFTIVGHEVSVDMISSAIAEHSGDGVYSTQSIEDANATVGFVTGIPQQLIGGYELDACTVMFLPHQISVFVSYAFQNDNERIMYTVHYFSDMAEAYAAYEQSSEGTELDILGETVYFTMNVNSSVASWLSGTSVHSITGQIDAEVLQCIVGSLIEGE